MFSSRCSPVSLSHQLPKAESWEKVQKYVLSVRACSNYASEAYSFDLVDTNGKLPDLLTGSIPEASTGVTASHVYSGFKDLRVSGGFLIVDLVHEKHNHHDENSILVISKTKSPKIIGHLE